MRLRLVFNMPQMQQPDVSFMDLDKQGTYGLQEALGMMSKSAAIYLARTATVEGVNLPGARLPVSYRTKSVDIVFYLDEAPQEVTRIPGNENISVVQVSYQEAYKYLQGISPSHL